MGEAYTLIRVKLAASHRPEAALAVLQWAWESGVTMLGTGDEEHERAAQILVQGASHRLSYFDGLLMAVAERHRVDEVITVDGGHFQALPLAHPTAVTVV